MLVAGLAEMLLSRVLTVWTCPKCRAYLLWLFCLVAIIYRGGLLIIHRSGGCSCLGIATLWIGPNLADWLSLLLLLVLAGLGALALRRGSDQRADTQTTACGRAIVLLFAIILSFDTHGQAGSVAIKGVYTYVPEQGQLTETRFDALLNREEMLLTYEQPNGGHYVPGPCIVTTRLDRDTNITHSLCRGQAIELVRMENATLSYEHGNRVTDLETAVILAIKVTSLFPLNDNEGQRRLAPTQGAIGLPLSLATIGRWKYDRGDNGLQLHCDVMIDPALLKSWPKSHLLSIDLRMDENQMRRERLALSRYKAGTLIEKLRWSRFTNVADVIFALQFEAERSHFILQRDPLLPIRVKKSWIQLVIHEVQTTDEPVPQILPIRAAEIHVTETRLQDRPRGIEFVLYKTNVVYSPSISESALVDFERRKKMVDDEAWALLIRKTVTAMILASILLTPVVMSWVMRDRSRVDNDYSGKKDA